RAAGGAVAAPDGAAVGHRGNKRRNPGDIDAPAACHTGAARYRAGVGERVPLHQPYAIATGTGRTYAAIDGAVVHDGSVRKARNRDADAAAQTIAACDCAAGVVGERTAAIERNT